MERQFGVFVWDIGREAANIEKHGVDFATASRVFYDAKRKVIKDIKHSLAERRYYCIGKVDDKILTIRFTYRRNLIRIFGAGYWRKGRIYYEEE